ncbi:MAG: energy-coupling factor transporter transmembrane component T family protein [Anaerolineae bacterium]
MKSRMTYQVGDSFVHQLHPLVKGAWLLALTVLVFAISLLSVVLSIVGFAVAMLLVARVSLKQNRHALALVVVTALTFGAFQVVFRDQGVFLAAVGPITITDGGLRAGVYVAGRFLAVVLLSYLFVLTTDPNTLAYALMRAGLPYRFGFAAVTALRLVPIFEVEARTVYEAQLARGIGHDLRGPRAVLTWIRRLMLPILVSALSKIDALAVSMEGRSFGRYPQRTFLRDVAFERRDALALAGLLFVIASAGLLAIRL